MKKYLCIIAMVYFGNTQAQSYWQPVADMLSPRNGHTATAFGDGKFVLVTGGYDGIGNVKTAEVYDVSNDTWTAVGDMDSIRFEHTATALQDGRILIAGGWNGGFINYKGTQIYDPASQTFIDGPDMTVGRSGHVAVLLSDGKVLITGGYTGSENTTVTDLFDPTTNTITQVASLHKGRSYTAATLMHDGNVLLMGGFNPDFGFQMNSTEIYNEAANTWTETDNLSVPRDYHACITLQNGNVMAAGGRFFNGTGYEGLTSVELFDPITQIWSDGADIPENQSYTKMAQAHDIILPGSTDQSGFGIDLTFSQSYAYNEDADTWEAKPMYNDGRYYYAVAPDVILDGIPSALVCGGADATVEIYTSLPLNINDFTTDAAIKLYPNPTHNYIKIHIDKFLIQEVSVYDMTGKKMITQKNNMDNISLSTLDISSLAAGFYTLEAIGTNHQTARAKFVKD